jgi:hypothetical protein
MQPPLFWPPPQQLYLPPPPPQFGAAVQPPQQQPPQQQPPQQQQYQVETPNEQLRAALALAAGAPGAAAPAANPYLPFGGNFFGGAAYLAASILPGLQDAQRQSELLAMAAATRIQQKLQEAKQHDQQLSKLVSFQQQTAAVSRGC